MCYHPRVHRGLCVQCNQVVERARLRCVLDLDNTLLHAAHHAADSSSVKDTQLITYQLQGGDDEDEDGDSLYSQDIKMRQDASEFLRRLSELEAYDVHVSTLGSWSYARAVMAVMDPDARVVPLTNIVTRDDASVSDRKCLRDVLPEEEAAAALVRSRTCIIDDRLDVWQADDCIEHVVHIVPFEVFVSSSRQSCFPHHVSRGGRDNVLATMASVLEALSHLYWLCDGKQSVPRILTCMRTSTLAGYVLVFSGVIPLGADATRTDAWMRAIAFGAQCIEPRHDADWATVTHLVCANAGSSKFRRARNERIIHLVSPDWLYASVAHFTRADESAFRISRRTEPLFSPTPIACQDLVTRALPLLVPAQPLVNHNQNQAPTHVPVVAPAPAPTNHRHKRRAISTLDTIHESKKVCIEIE